MKKTYEPTYERVIITPEMATEMLEHNTRNRKISQQRVNQYADMMTKGEFLENGTNAIVFDINGTLMNGQHELLAVKKSKCSLPFLVARGVDPMAVETIDCGKPRSAADALSITHPGKNRPRIASAARLLISYEKGHFGSCLNVSHREIRMKFEAAPELEELVSEGGAVASKINARANVMTVFAYVVRKAVKQRAFFRGLKIAASLPAGDPRLALWKYLSKPEAQAVKHPEDRYKLQWAALTEAWNAYVEGRSLKRIDFPFVDGRVNVGSPRTPLGGTPPTAPAKIARAKPALRRPGAQASTPPA